MSEITAHVDENQNNSIIGVQGTLGTADVKGTAPTLPFSVNPTNGAANVTMLNGITQDITADTNNSSTVPLNAGSTFTGLKTSTLGVAGIQVSLKTDQNCIVYIDQSPDGDNWDLTDEYNYFASINNFGLTVQAINSYVRVRVTNTSLVNTTYFRLQTALCPIVEALPRSLNSNGQLKTKMYGIEDEYGFEVENTPMGEMRTITPTRLVGANFEGGTLDSSFWISGVANSGTVVQANAEAVLSTTTTATNGMARLYSLRRARYVSGSSMCYRSVIVLSAAVANNKRRFGIAFASTMPTTGTTDLMTDGAWFQFNGTTFGVAVRRAGIANETLVESGAFNGTLGTTYTPGTTVKTYEIYWTNSKVVFTVGGRILHTINASTTTWSSTMNFYIYMDNVNSGDIQTNHTLSCRVASIRRLGPLLTQPTSYYFATGQTAGVNLKLGVGNLHSLILSNVIGGAVITLSDSISTTTPTIFSLTGAAQENSTTIDFKGLPFFFGLRLTIATKNASAVVIYE